MDNSNRKRTRTINIVCALIWVLTLVCSFFVEHSGGGYFRPDNVNLASSIFTFFISILVLNFGRGFVKADLMLKIENPDKVEPSGWSIFWGKVAAWHFFIGSIILLLI